MKLYDAHTHLNANDLYPQWEKHLFQFICEWWVALVNAGANDQYNVRGIEIAKMKDGEKENCIVKSTIGYHPDCCNNGDITEENIQQKITDLKKLYENNKEYIVAIGECWIDTYYPGSEDSLELQKKLFILQCDLAKELWLPLMIHMRKNFDSAVEILRQYRDMTIYIHCRGFWPEEVEILIIESWKLNWELFIGFCGNVTYKNAQNLRDSLAKVSLDQLILETDAPWLSPQVVRGTANHPAHVKYIYEFVADYLSLSWASLALQIEKNFLNLYKF